MMDKKSTLNNKGSKILDKNWNPDRVFFILCSLVVILSSIILFERLWEQQEQSCAEVCNSSLNIDYFDIAKELYEENSLIKKSEIRLQNLLLEKSFELNYLEAKANSSNGLIASEVSRVGLDDIKIYNDRVIFYVDKTFPVTISPSRSMYPFINNNAIALERKVKSADEITIGDIIGFQSKVFNTSVIHRVINISMDNDGWYATTKGDSNPAPDIEKVRFSQVVGVLVGLVY